MKRTATFLFALALFTIPLFYHSSLFFPDQAKWNFLAILLPLPFLLGPALEAMRRGTIPFPSPHLAILGLLGLAIASALWTASGGLWRHGSSTWMLGTLAAMLAAWIARHREQTGDEPWKALLTPLLGAGCIAAVIVLAQKMGLDPLDHPFDTQSSPIATFGNTNHAGEFLAPLAAAAFALAVTQRGFWGHWGMIALFLLCAALSALHVRAAWIAAGAGLFIAIWLLWRGLAPRQRTLLVAPCLATALGFAAPKFLIPEPPAQVQTARAKNTIEVRKKVYAATMRLIAENPLLGCGAGNFSAAFPPLRDPEEIEISSHRRADPAESLVEEPHNDYLLVASELGLLGAAFAAWIGWSILRLGKRASYSLGSSIAFAGLVAIGVQALFRSPLTNPSSSLLFWMFLGWIGVETKTAFVFLAGRARIAALAGILALVWLAWTGVQRIRAEFYLANGELPRAVELDPYDPKKWEIYGRERRLAQDPVGAATAYERLLALNPNHFNGRLQRGLVAIDLADLERARSEFSKAAPLDTNNPRLTRAQALLRYREGDDLAAIALLRQAIARGANPNTIRDFGREIEKAGESERALKYYQTHAELHPDDADAWMAIGQIFRNRGDEAESRQDFARAHRLYGLEHLRAKKASDAERQFRLYRKFAPSDDPAPDLFLAAAALAKGDRPAVESALREASARGARQANLLAPGLESIAADASLRSILSE